MRYRYSPPLKMNWQGRSDGGPDSLRFHEIVTCCSLEDSIPKVQAVKPFALLGFSSDEGIRRNLGRQGARFGPFAFREAFAKLPVHGIDRTSFFDFGDICCLDDHLEEAQDGLAASVKILVEHQFTPIIIGGGHELSYGAYKGLMVSPSIINFDAHFDLRSAAEHKGTSGTPFLQIAEHLLGLKKTFDYTCIGVQKTANTTVLFQTASNLKTNYLLADEMAKSEQLIKEKTQDALSIYVSIDLDVFAEAFAPGVSAPTPEGLTPWQVIPLLKDLALSKKVCCLSIAELSPPHDQSGMTARLSAALLAEYLYSVS